MISLASKKPIYFFKSSVSVERTSTPPLTKWELIAYDP